ncbi:MAG: bifunctional indole-3-glycerol-phosphate synthase TrpC/phosphoribosylanthranilate isomerase TrpF [Gemmatimonadales bacterium]
MALDAILAAKRSDLALRRAARPLATLLEGLLPSDRSFYEALRVRRPAFIFEIKPASPSEGQLRAVADMTPAIDAYAKYADVISVLTDRPFFGGSHALLARVRAAVQQPVLCKDFVLDPYQVFEARRAGADAVLLMLSILDDRSYRACADAAASVGMGVLTEAHSADEVIRARRLGARVVGINNRDLTTLEVRLETTATLAHLAGPSAILIAESGIRTRHDVCQLADTVDGFLIGTATMRATNVAQTVKELVFGPTKVCGLSRARDVEAASDAGATHAGFIFAPESPRCVSLRLARELRQTAQLQWVGVFVNDSVPRIAKAAELLHLSAVQLHGEETDTEVMALRQQLPRECAIWKAVRVREAIPPCPPGADRLLLDSYHTSLRGGTGRRFDWALVGNRPGADRLILSGGIAADNLSRAHATGIDFLDVNSSVELAPGIKSAAALDYFFSVRRSRSEPRKTTP